MIEYSKAPVGADHGPHQMQEDKVERLDALAREVAHFATMANTSKIFAGRALLEARKLFSSDRDFGAWREQSIPGLHRDTALDYMHVAKEYGDKPQIVEALSMRALRALSAPSTPQSVREKIETSIQNGASPTAAEIEALKREASAAAKRAEEAEANADRYKKQAETLLEGQAALVEKAKQEARAKIEADLKAAKEEAERAKTGLKDAQTRLSEAEKKAEEAATAKAQAQAAKLADEEVQKRQREIDAAKKELDKIRSDISKRNDILTDIENRVEERREFLDKLTNADHEAEQLVKELEEMNRVLALALLVVSDVDYDHGEEVLAKVRSSASMCRKMADALDAIGRPRLVYDARA